MLAAGVRFSSECVAEVQKQRMLLWDAAGFLLSHQIPALVSLAWNVCMIFKMICVILLPNICLCVW